MKDAVFEGQFSISFIGTGGSAAGLHLTGVLSLSLRPDSLRDVPDMAGNASTGVLEIAFGALQGNLERVGGFTEGSTTSSDPSRPGVVVRVYPSASSPRSYRLEFGSQANTRDMWVLDGNVTSAEVWSVDPRGFLGFWRSSRGYTTYDASGHFCATRLAG